MRCFAATLLAALCVSSTSTRAQAPETKPIPAATLSVQAKLVVLPATVFDKKGLNTSLSQKDFAISVDGKPQTIRYFDKGEDEPLTVGLLIDVSRSQTSVIDQEQKAGDQFLSSFLRPVSGSRAADKGFILQFGHTAELLQDVTDSRPLLAAGLKQVGTETPGAPEDRTADSDSRQQNDSSNSGNQGGSSQGGTGQGGTGGYGRRGRGQGGGGQGTADGNRARGGTVLYDAVFLASSDVEAHQAGRRAVVLLTDGVDRHSKESLVEAIEAAQRADTVVYAIYYKGEEDRPFRNGGFGYPGGGGGGYGRGGYPGSGGRPGSDGTYADPDGRKILERICGETGGRVFQLKGKDGAAEAFKQIGEELRAQYRLGFTPTAEAAASGYHPVQVSLTDASLRKAEIQTRDGYYAGPPKSSQP